MLMFLLLFISLCRFVFEDQIDFIKESIMEGVNVRTSSFCSVKRNFESLLQWILIYHLLRRLSKSPWNCLRNLLPKQPWKSSRCVLPSLFLHEKWFNKHVYGKLLAHLFLYSVFWLVEINRNSAIKDPTFTFIKSCFSPWSLICCKGCLVLLSEFSCSLRKNKRAFNLSDWKNPQVFL